MRKIILALSLIMLTSVVHGAAYIKIGDIKGESKAMANAKKGYKALSRSSKTINVAKGKESSLAPGFYLHPNGKVVKVTDSKHVDWINLDSVSNTKSRAIKEKGSGMSSGKREKGSGMATGKRQHKPVVIPKADCVKGVVVRGKHKDKKCTHRGHVTVLK